VGSRTGSRPNRRSGSRRPGPGGLATACIALYLLLLPVQVSASSIRLAPSDAFLLAYLFLRLPRFRQDRRAWAGWHAALLSVFALGLLVALVRNGTVTRFALFEKTFGLVLLFLTYACLIDFLDSWERIRWTLRVFVAGVAVHTGVALAAYALQNANAVNWGFINEGKFRLSGFLIDPNAFGGVIVVSLVLLVFTSVSSRPLLPRGWGWAATAVLSLGLALTFSRSAWAACAFALLVSFLVHPQTVSRAWGRIVLPAGVGVAVFALVYLPTLSELATRPGGRDRLSIVRGGLDQFEHSPVVGGGLGVYSVRHGVIIHNTLMWFLADLGALGFLVLVGFLVWYFTLIVRVIVNNTGPERAIGFGLLAAHAAMIGLSLGIESLYQRGWWVMLACAAAAALMTSAPARRTVLVPIFRWPSDRSGVRA